jgi:hypothetical protein
VRRGYLVVPADRIVKATGEALAPGAIRLLSTDEGEADEGAAGESFRAAYAWATGGEANCVRGRIGFRREPESDLWALLRGNPALLMKALYSLWARLYAASEPAPGAFTLLSLSQFCDDLGYVRLANGAHRPERKRQARLALRLLAALELDAVYRAPNGATTRLRGPLLTLRVLDERGRFCVAPGAWFFDPLWRKYNRFTGMVGAGLLRLEAGDRDKWAVLVGGILAPLARINGYEPLRLRVAHLLETSGLLRAERRNPGRMLDKLERALDRLQEAGVLGAWEYEEPAVSEPDMDSPRELAALADAARDRMEKRLLIHWSVDLAVRAGPLRAARKARRRDWRRR